MIIEGSISLKAAINNQKRDIEKVYIDKDKRTKDFSYIRRLCLERNIPIEETDREKLNEMASKSNGGLLAYAGERRNDELTEGDIFYLDGIEDPFNLGYAMRTLYAFGFKNVLLPHRDYSNMEGQLLKSSAGAYDMLNIKISENPYADIKQLKKENYYVYGLCRNDGSSDIFEETFNNKAIFMLGGEKRGISSRLLNLCDRFIHISYGSDFRNSLNACAALDVTATLLYRQRRK